MFARVVSIVAVVACVMCLSFARAGEPPEPDAASPAAGLRNGDFMASGTDGAPLHWFVPTAGFDAKVVEDAEAPGKLAAEVTRKKGGGDGAGAIGNLMQSFDATAFRGKRVVVKASVRLIHPTPLTEATMRDSRAQLWLRVDRPKEQMGFFDNMGDRPIRGLRSSGFQAYTMSGIVADDANSINIGMMVFGGSPARIADVQVFAVEPGEDADRPAAALSERGLANLVAFAKLYGYVRFFHPSDEAAAGGVNWNEFAIAAVEHVEGAASDEELAAALRDVFAPIAPTVQVWAGDVANAPAVPGAPEDAAPKFVAWRHNGCGLSEGPMQIYTSKRETSKVESPATGLPAPGTSVVKSLGGGVACRVPVSVWANEKGKTLPKGMGAMVPLKPPVARPEWWSPSGKDRSTRLGDVVIAWNVFQHFYPYFDVVKTEWEPVLARSLASAASDADDAAFVRTLQRLVADLHDGHGHVHASMQRWPMPPDIVLSWAEDGKGKLALVVAAAGASAGGTLKRGDVIVEIAGRATDEVYRESLGYISAATDQWARHRFVGDAQWIAPGSGEDVAYRVRRGSELLDVRVPRAAENATLVKEKRPANGEEVAPGVFYFNLNGTTAEELAAVMPKLETAEGIVFDARGYPNSAGTTSLQHLTGKYLRSARWIVPEVTLPDRDAAGFVMKPSGRWNLPPMKPRLGADGQKVAFLIGGGAISYAETCMGIVEHYKLGAIVGEATAGTNGNVNPFSLPGGYNVSWTGMKVLKHDKSVHHGLGILPTVPVTRTVEGIAAGKDEVLEAGVRAVSE